MDEFSENTAAEPRQPSIDADEVAKFSAMAAEWWDPKGKFKPLHKFNPVRLGFIRDTACSHFGLDETARKPLEGIRVLDIGCGGGLVSEPMARLGASVTGVDASEANIKTALTHAREGGLEIDYRAGTAEGLLEAG
ncbi:MAG: bifunctional 2-polyprenyl-6-hydroxyphenol methylase/3-demethylubiquinol 3-O-methyltransferase UbiG, partial [Henriciella sp.]|nr:bifunctional 2-polyprenyl-6-hydroxyphenol methylase/3-demethylubiquinol 3-O-methyltransferase UbiG [Henriciella sp.]